jgi:N-ethylmaleimide reductase
MLAGFDGVEIHGANGYLLDQFLEDGSNHRTDAYGGPVMNRARLMLEVTEAVCAAIGSERTGIRLSPSGLKMDMSDSNPVGTFTYLVEKLNHYGLAYLHLIEPVMAPLGPEHSRYLKVVTPFFRKVWKGTLISNGGYNAESARITVEDGHADIIAFGKAYISNPDLVERVAKEFPFASWDSETFYGGDERGYNDYQPM